MPLVDDTPVELPVPYDPTPILTAVYNKLNEELAPTNAKTVALNLINQAITVLANDKG